MADPDTHSPESSQILVLSLPLSVSMGASMWIGLFVGRRGGICLLEQVNGSAGAQQNMAWMRPEHNLSQVDILNAHRPRWKEPDLIFPGEGRCPHPAITQHLLADGTLDCEVISAGFWD